MCFYFLACHLLAPPGLHCLLASQIRHAWSKGRLQKHSRCRPRAGCDMSTAWKSWNRPVIPSTLQVLRSQHSASSKTKQEYPYQVPQEYLRDRATSDQCHSRNTISAWPAWPQVVWHANTYMRHHNFASSCDLIVLKLTCIGEHDHTEQHGASKIYKG